jgi:hypothetical protein
MNHELLLKLAALLHLGLIAAGLTMPRVVRLKEHLAPLPIFIRRLFWVYYTFIGFVLLSFGALTWGLAAPMAAGELPARGLTLMMATFWIIRLAVGAFVLDEKPYLTSWFYRLGFYALNFVFIYLAVIYTCTAFFPKCL